MKQILASLSIIFLLSYASYSQDYKTGIGLRGGTQNGLTIKHFINNKSAIEGLIATRWEGFYVTGLYEFTGPYFDVPGMNWYYGLGMHMGFLGGDNSRFDDGEDHTIAGIDLMFGVEYKFEKAPISIGLDWKPQYDFIGDSYFIWDDAAFSARFTF